MIRLSIIIPHYNSTESLGQLIETIPTKEEIEVIVIDDRSDSNYRKDLDRLEKANLQKNIRFYNNELGRKSAGTCRNIGINKARGKWLLFADADDFFLNGFYEVVSSYCRTNNDVIFFTPTSVERQTGNVSDRHLTYKKVINNYIQNKTYKSELYLRYNFFVPWSKLIRTNFLKENNIYFDEVIASNDVMFSTKVGYYMKNFIVSDEVIYCVTRDSGSLSVNISEKVFDARLKVHINYCQFLKSNLSLQDQKYFNIRGTGYILNVIKYRLGISKLFSTFFLLRKSNIKVFDFKYLNPAYTIKRIIYQYRKYKANKGYFGGN